jgi:hypothetical protein
MKSAYYETFLRNMQQIIVQIWEFRIVQVQNFQLHPPSHTKNWRHLILMMRLDMKNKIKIVSGLNL